jgi:hypothetical protein
MCVCLWAFRRCRMYHSGSESSAVDEAITGCKSGLGNILGVTSSTSTLPVATVEPAGRQYLAAQAIVCFLQAVNNRCKLPQLQLARVLALLQRDDGTGLIPTALAQYSDTVPVWMWVTWIPQLLAGLGRPEELPLRKILSKIAAQYPQAVYYTLRAFVLEKREIAAGQAGSSVSNTTSSSEGHRPPVSVAASQIAGNGKIVQFGVCFLPVGG